jgi:hypothetical protein
MALAKMKPQGLYWWRGINGLRILIRCEYLAQEYARCRVVAATAEEVLRTGYGAGESFNMALANAPIEEAK